jgi:hypothetical protein
VNPSLLYCESQTAFVGWVDLSRNDYGPVNHPAGDYLFISPFTLDPNQHRRLWLGGTQMWRCDNAIAETCLLASTAMDGTVSAIVVTPGNSDRVIAGTNLGAIARTDKATSANGQTAWTAVKPRDGFVSSLALDPADPSITWATFAQFGGGAHVWRSADGGAGWAPLDGRDAGALPDIPVHSIAPDPTRPGRIFIGTDLGVFVSIDGGDHWMIEASDFANAVTEQVTIAQGANGPAIYAFTHGRGVWRADLVPTPARRRAIRH